MSHFQRMAAVFPVRDIERAADHYRKLGFKVSLYEGPEDYAFAEREGIEIHLTRVRHLKRKRNMSAVYLYVDDADALFEEWNQAATGGRLVEPTDAPYGLREGAILDSDANLIRFGSPIPRR